MLFWWSCSQQQGVRNADVLILVIVDVVLIALPVRARGRKKQQVLILVIVDVVLIAFFSEDMVTFTWCLNPCYSGCCSDWILLRLQILLLPVLILVIVDVVLIVLYVVEGITIAFSLNPCYSGCCSDCYVVSFNVNVGTSLNPCYSGCCSDCGGKRA